MALPIYIYAVETGEDTELYVSCLSEQQASKGGLPPEAIVGVLSRSIGPGETITPEIFTVNTAFKAFMQDLIARHGPRIPDLLEAARIQGTGWVYVIDQRTKTPGGEVPAWDIVGGFEVRDGALVAGSYQPNPGHRVLSEDGFVVLEAELQKRLLEELASRT